MKKIIPVLCCLGLAACANSGYRADYWINELVVHNLSGGTVENVQLRVKASPKLVACDRVAFHAICQQRFGKRRYPQQGFEVDWTHADGGGNSEIVDPAIPAYFSSAFALRVVVEIREDGSLNSFFEQEEPGRDGIFVDGML